MKSEMGQKQMRGSLYTALVNIRALVWTTSSGLRGFLTGDPLTTVCSVVQSCPTLCDPMDCSPPGFSVHGIFQARILEQVAVSYSRGSS